MAKFLNPGPELDIHTDKLFLVIGLMNSLSYVEPKAPGRALVPLGILGTILLLLFHLNKFPAFDLQKVQLFLRLSILIKIGGTGDA